MLTSAFYAGVVAGLLAALLHFAFVQKYILLGETYETGAAVHFAGSAPAAEPVAAHDHSTHDHGDAPSAFTRNAWTVVFSGLIYVAYALVLVAGFGLARIYGHTIAAHEGLLWGIAGFASFQLAPAMGLAPELPGTIAADLGARQVWWWGTVAATGTALALLAYGRSAGAALCAMLLLAAPHVIGAPVPDGFSGTAPPELAAAFAARVLGVGLAVWATLGWVAGFVWSKDADNAVSIR